MMFLNRKSAAIALQHTLLLQSARTTCFVNIQSRLKFLDGNDLASPRVLKTVWLLVLLITAIFGLQAESCAGNELSVIQQTGVLRHLGVPYANFVTGSGDGLDVELMQRFAAYLGVKYQYVQTSWSQVIGDLCGKRVKAKGGEIDMIGNQQVRGDVIANGLTILPWRQKIIDYSTPIFPTQIWLLARAGADLKPIMPSGDTFKDIQAVKAQLNGRRIFGKPDTCLDPSLYGIEQAGAQVALFSRNLNELAPAVINRQADATLLDVPDALIALKKWPGQVKVIGPLSPMQYMGVGFPQSSPRLKAAFNDFLEHCKKDGTYLALVKKYYPAVFGYYPDFFKAETSENYTAEQVELD
jgi:ABC-type amino acid transport substrate-binding protein